MRFDIFRGPISHQSSEWSKKESPKIRTVFMGTPDIAKTILSALVENEYNIVAAYTQPDRPTGRDREIIPSPVKSYATEKNIPVEQPERFDESAIERLKSFRADLIVVAAYGKILPKEVIDIPGFGCLNIHASLLPRWRGASPVQNALISGDTETGVTIMLMDEGMDTGPIISQEAVAISDSHNAQTLLDELAGKGASLLLQTIPLWIRKKVEAQDQDGSQATLCELIEREDGRIFWNTHAEDIWNRFRGLTPWPGIFTFWKKGNGEFSRLKLVTISFEPSDPDPKRRIGEVFEWDSRVAVQSGKGCVILEEIQASGKDSLPIKDFLNGNPSLIGSIFE